MSLTPDTGSLTIITVVSRLVKRVRVVLCAARVAMCCIVARVVSTVLTLVVLPRVVTGVAPPSSIIIQTLTVIVSGAQG